MHWTPKRLEIEAVLSLDAMKRYQYWIKKVADQQQVWSLWHEGNWVLAGDDSGSQLVPVWPHASYASLCATGVWNGSDPKVIPLHVWLDRWIPGMEGDHRRVAVFPTPSDQGISMEPKKVEDDLRNELLNYE